MFKATIAALGIILFGPPPAGVPPPPVIFNLPEIMYEIATETPETIDTPSFAIETPVIAEKGQEIATIPSYLSSCVAFVRKFSKYNNFPRIDSAKDIPALKFSPAIDDLIIFNAGGQYGKHGHVGIVRAVVGDSIVVEEANLLPNQRSTRLIKWRGEGKDEYIKGYFGWDKK